MVLNLYVKVGPGDAFVSKTLFVESIEHQNVTFINFRIKKPLYP